MSIVAATFLTLSLPLVILGSFITGICLTSN